MKHKRYKAYDNSDDAVLRYIVNNVEDLYNTDRFKTDMKFSEMLNTSKERDAKRKARKLFTEMMEMIADDLIYNNDNFVFPFREFGSMCVTDIASRGILNYRYKYDTDGAIYGLKVGLSKRVRDHNLKFYRGRFNRENQNKVNELIAQGHRY